MKVTFIVKRVTDVFWQGNGGSIQGLDNMTDLERLEKLFKYSDLPEYQITSKIGNGSFRDKVDLNALKRNGWTVQDYKKENRKGYKLVAFIIK